MSNRYSTTEAMAWYARMLRSYHEDLTDEEREELETWQAENASPGGKAAADWPGWERYAGKPPWKAGPPE